MTRTQFDELGENYFEIKGGHVHVYYAEKKADVVKSFLKNNFSVLDIGCGAGEHTKLLSKSCEQIHGIDLSLEMVKSANKNLGKCFALSLEMVKSANKNLGKCFALRSDAIRLPFKDSSFDVVYTSNTLHHIKELPQIEKAISEMVRVARKHVIIFEFNSMNPFCKYLLFKLCPYDNGDERIPTKKEMKTIFDEIDLKEIDIRHKSFMPMFCPQKLIPAFSRLESFLEGVIPQISVGMVYVLSLNEE